MDGVEKKEKPTLTPLTDMERAEQQDVCFETTVSGKPEPTVEWYHFTAIYASSMSSISRFSKLKLVWRSSAIILTILLTIVIYLFIQL